MTIIVHEDCVALGLRAGAIVFRDVHVAPSASDLRSQILQEVQEVRMRFAGLQDVRATPEVAGFREILRKVGVNPRKVQPSVERLIGFALKRGDLPAINNLVDAYNLVSVRSLCSLGAHDLDTISLPVTLRRLGGHESFTPLGGTAEEPVTGGEFGYVDSGQVVLCRLDVLQAEFSKVTTSSRNVLLIVEGTVGHSAQLLDQAVQDIIELVARHCGGTAEVVAYPEYRSR
jgi:DNA/RNA-binding domain of Phe-tRNA-synthetase-like protein